MTAIMVLRGWCSEPDANQYDWETILTRRLGSIEDVKRAFPMNEPYNVCDLIRQVRQILLLAHPDKQPVGLGVNPLTPCLVALCPKLIKHLKTFSPR